MTTPENSRNDTTVQVRIEAHTNDNARAYVAGRDQYIFHNEQAPAPVTALRTLPRDVSGFTGRHAEIERLVAAQSTGVVAIDGMAGVGKTALAVHAAHQLAERYPDGQLFVDLRAHTTGRTPADPSDVLATLLIGIGISPQTLPDTLEERASLWRDQLVTRRMLLILDNAADPAQVEPLLPASRQCLVLITSRRRLIALDGAEPLPLDILPHDQAARLFTCLARRTPADADYSAVAETVRLCGHLPLAITLLAGRLAHHPTWDIATFTDEFATAQDRLGELEAGNRAVAAAFDLSYRDLAPHLQRLFRLLGLHPGPDIDPYATAALADISPTQARRQLETLYVDHLIEEPTRHRHRLHDLLREYAHALTNRDPSETRTQASRRLLNYYTHTAQTADRHLTTTSRPHIRNTPKPDAAPELITRADALTWMRTEYSNLLACAHHTTTHTQPTHLLALTGAMATFMYQQGPWDQAIALHHTSAEAAHHTNNRLGEANALWDLGRVQRITSNFVAAAELFGQSLQLYCDLGNRLGEANARWDLGRVQRMTGDYPRAAEQIGQALELYRVLNDRLGEANTLLDLGRVQRATGDYPRAAEQIGLALELYRNLGNRHGETHALLDLGRGQYSTGDYPGAAELFRQALRLYRDLGNRLGEAHALRHLGRVQHVTGNYAAATEQIEEALELYHTLGNRDGEANTLQDLGRTRTQLRDYTAATDLLAQSRELFEEVGDIKGVAEALNSTGDLLTASGSPQQALASYQQALLLARQVRSPLNEAHALEGVARCKARTDTQAAIADLRKAVAIYQRIGAAETPAAKEYLTNLEAG